MAAMFTTVTATWVISVLTHGTDGISGNGRFDGLGLRAIRRHLRGEESREPCFVVRGPYRWVRHPLYTCALVLIWAHPQVTLDRLLFAVLWTAWIVVGTRLEERDLVAHFGEPYRRYQREVPMLLPWKRPRDRDGTKHAT